MNIMHKMISSSGIVESLRGIEQQISSLSDFTWSDFIPVAATALVGIAGILAQMLAARWNLKEARIQDRKREVRESLASFYIPLSVILGCLVAVMEEYEHVDLWSFDPEDPEQCEKFEMVGVHCEALSALLRSPNMAPAALNNDLAESLGVLYAWVIGIECRAERNRDLGAGSVRDDKALAAMREIISQMGNIKA